MQDSRYNYQLCQISTVRLPERLSDSTEKTLIEVLYHPDAPFSIRELYDDILPTLGQEYLDAAAYFQTPVPMSLVFVQREQDFIAILTFHRAFHDMTLVHMKWLKKVIASLSKKYPCEVAFIQPVV